MQALTLRVVYSSHLSQISWFLMSMPHINNKSAVDGPKDAKKSNSLTMTAKAHSQGAFTLHQC